MSLFPPRERTGVWWRDHSLSLVIGTIFVLQTLWVLLNGHAEWVSQQLDHGTKGPHGWPLEFWQWIGFEYVNSLVADTYGVLLIILATKWFYERGSAESQK